MAGRGSYGGRRRSLTTRTTRSGYQQFKDPRTGQWVLTHRRVAEKLVGGKIYPGREVHHIDGDKNNNRPENLTIVSKEQHRRIHGKK
jgi:hypothetical protein